ncbi:IncI1 plasmid conjugative transfer protein TraJ, related to pilus biogenesis/retracton protein [Escherichia coli ISC7]|uniref:IncI1 plasmid conjugative transfer protein TraJ, related to pilus biogenesis/retracton protein n=1 Tax=Escherichia coli ISC7 TaxID=1432555 RepID=W1F1J7_ECOLX|nr:IncI1 plasmid conjugative transfer protein TraJ, related to pilus biogenesis/retracton protein [Escherichia coli ISC7]
MSAPKERKMISPDDFGTFPFSRFTAEEFRHFFCLVCPPPRQ